jgi:hypothetical protein
MPTDWHYMIHDRLKYHFHWISVFVSVDCYMETLAAIGLLHFQKPENHEILKTFFDINM